MTAVKNGDIRPVDDTEITRPGSAPADRAAQPGAGDVPRPQPAAGAMTAADGGLRRSRRTSATVGLAGRVRGRPGLIAALGIVGSARAARRGRVAGVGPHQPGRHRSGSSSGACSASTPGTPGPPRPRRSSGSLRLPRVLTAMLVGAGLAVAGATFQGLVRNPLADPYVLGTASGRRARRRDRRPAPGPARDRRVRPASTGWPSSGALLTACVVLRARRLRADGRADAAAADRLRGRRRCSPRS